jgi:hypothetical protein
MADIIDSKQGQKANEEDLQGLLNEVESVSEETARLLAAQLKLKPF